MYGHPVLRCALADPVRVLGQILQVSNASMACCAIALAPWGPSGALGGRDQFPQHVGAVQRMVGTGVGVVGGPGVVHRGPGESRQDPHRVHGRGPAPRVHRQQAEPAGLRRMHPLQRALDPDRSGLVEPGDRRGSDPRAHLLGELAQVPRRPGGRGGDRAWSHRRAEDLAHDPATPALARNCPCHRGTVDVDRKKGFAAYTSCPR